MDDVTRAVPGEWDQTEGDQRVAEWLIGRFRTGDLKGQPFGGGDIDHLRVCHLLDVEFEGTNGSYNCDTGCEYARLEATIRCPHTSGSVDVEYGEFGELADLMEDIFG